MKNVCVKNPYVAQGKAVSFQEKCQVSVSIFLQLLGLGVRKKLGTEIFGTAGSFARKMHDFAGPLAAGNGGGELAKM
jgi:hypothetical protein